MPSGLVQTGAAIAAKSREHHMFRAALFLIVLTLAVGPDAGLLCTVWCVPHDATSAACPHHDATISPSVRGDDNCNNLVTRGEVAFVREDGRSTARASDSRNAVIVRGFQITQAPTDLWFGRGSGRLRLLEHRPLVVALRI